jgi:hypothetical protein
MARLRFWSLFLLVLLVAVSVVSVRAGAWFILSLGPRRNRKRIQ